MSFFTYTFLHTELMHHAVQISFALKLRLHATVLIYRIFACTCIYIFSHTQSIERTRRTRRTWSTRRTQRTRRIRRRAPLAPSAPSIPGAPGAFHDCSLIFALLLPYYFLKRTIIVILLLPCKTFTVLLLKNLKLLKKMEFFGFVLGLKFCQKSIIWSFEISLQIGH